MPIFGSTSKKRHVERQHPRIKRPYKVEYSLDRGETTAPAFPVDISIGGLGILHHDEIEPDEFVVVLTLDSAKVTALVARAASIPGTLKGERAWRTGGKFVGIPADQWDVILRFVQSVPVEQTDKLKAELRELLDSPDDALRILPKAVLDTLLRELVKMRRLAPLNDRVTPLVKLHYLGRARYKEYEMHALRVDSRLVLPHEVRNFTTQIYFDDAIAKIITVPLDAPPET